MKLKKLKHGEFYFFENDMIGSVLDEFGEWSELELQFLLSLCPPRSTVVDVGAHIGTFTVPFAKKVGPAGVVISIEPQRLIFSNLVSNIFINRLRNVSVHNKICSQKPFFMPLREIPLDSVENSGGFQVPHEDEIPRDFELKRDWRFTQAEPLDAILSGLTRLDLLKVDVEGYEREVLAGAETTVSRLRPLIHCECLSAEAFEGLVRYSDRHGYLVFESTFPSFNPSNFFGAPLPERYREIQDRNLLLWPNDRPVPPGLTLEPCTTFEALSAGNAPHWVRG